MQRTHRSQPSANVLHGLLGGVLLLGSGACVADLGGEPGVAVSEERGKDSAAVIIGSVDWLDVAALAEGSAAKANASTVAYLSIPAAGSRCTGFLIAPDVLMTNHHCIPNADAARGVEASFRYQTGAAAEAPIDCSTFIGNDATLDFALLQCAGRPGDRYGVVGLDSRAALAAERVYVVHQNCDYYADSGCAPTKKYSAGVVRQTGNEIGHDADTLGGSSGSPLFGESSHTVIGLHHAGAGNGGNGRGTVNWAVPMARIVPVLQQRFPGLHLGAATPSTPSAPSSDLYEPNDIRGGATIASLPFSSVAGAAIESSVQVRDVDVFTFTASNAHVTLDLGLRHAAGDLDVSVIDSAGQQVASSTGTTDREHIEGTFNGTYFVVVVGYAGAAGAYTLSLR